MRAKQKIVHGRGLSNLNLAIFVCSFDVCRASKPVPSINNGSNDYLVSKWFSALAFTCLYGFSCLCPSEIQALGGNSTMTCFLQRSSPILFPISSNIISFLEISHGRRPLPGASIFHINLLSQPFPVSFFFKKHLAGRRILINTMTACVAGVLFFL